MRAKWMLPAFVMASGLVLAACGSSGDEVSAGSGPTVGETAGAIEASPAAEATAAAPSTSPLLLVVGNVVVPDGEGSDLTVVLVGQPGSSVPLVVRNLTGSTLYRIEASAVARAADGSLAGSGGSQLGFNPSVVEPGEWAFGYVYFGADLPKDATIDVTATGHTEPGTFLPSVDVTPVEINVVEGQFSQQIVGIVSNGSTEDVTGPIGVTAVCFDESGTAIAGRLDGYADSDTIIAGGTASFSIGLAGNDCPNFALGASGYGA